MPQNSRASGANEDRVPRDNQQMQDDNQTSGESVLSGQISGDNQQPIRRPDTSDDAAEREPAPGVRTNAKGDTHA
jgi:hypothetical protein